MSWCVCFNVAELHPTLEAVCQRHRQRPGLCSRGHVCQSHLYRGQQGHCKHFKVLFLTITAPTVCGVMCSWLSLTLLCFRLRIWSQKLNGHLRTAWSMWAGWTQRQKKQQKKRWEKDVVDLTSPLPPSHCCFRETSVKSWEIQHCHLVWKYVFYSFLFYLSQADAIYNMVGYPEFIMNTTKLDKVFNDVGKGDFMSLLFFYHVSLCLTKTLSFIFLSLLIAFFSFSSRWCQTFTSKTLCSTTTSQPEWLQTSWGKLPTETSELLPRYSPHPPPPRLP